MNETVMYWVMRFGGNMGAQLVLYAVCKLLGVEATWRVLVAAFVFYTVLTITDAVCLYIRNQRAAP